MRTLMTFNFFCFFCLAVFNTNSFAHCKTVPNETFRYYKGGIIKKNTKLKEISLVFSADIHAQGALLILTTLKQNQIQAGFFLTGNFLNNPANFKFIEKMKKGNHYIGPHSFGHLRYNHWGNNAVLVTENEFAKDIKKNLRSIAGFGIDANSIGLFLPPFETYNKTISKWANSHGLNIFSFSPGTLTYRDWMPKNHRFYISSKNILKGLAKKLKNRKNSFKGAIFLIHLGVHKNRPDPFYLNLGNFLQEFIKAGYEFIRIDEFLKLGLEKKRLP